MKGVDLDRRQLTVRRAKNERDRSALVPNRASDALRIQLAPVLRRHREELAAGRGVVVLPSALRLKIPGAATSLACQYVFFPTPRACARPTNGPAVLHLRHDSQTQIDRGPPGLVSPLDR
ncbi:MAG: hypothetical protein U0324_38360 [Polyangiales bacterium]